MLSPQSFRCFNISLGPRILLTLMGRDFSSWNATRVSGVLPLMKNAQRCQCHLTHLQKTKTVFKQVYFISIRNKSTKREDDSDLEFVDPEIEEIDEEMRISNPKKRVKVKFDWRNSIVTTDALKLLEQLYQSYPQLIEFNEEDLLAYFQRMSIYSLDVEKSAKMVIMNPRLIKLSDDSVAACVNSLRSIGLSESQRGHVLRTIPQLFNFPVKRIRDQFAFIKTYLSTTESVDAICKSVNILVESETTLKSKLEYLIMDMSHETKNIVSSKALSFSLKHMKTRHEFLIRCGFFKPIPYRKLIKVLEKEYRDKSKPRDKYFKPAEIVCYKDADFLKVCTKNLLTLNEYAAFEELYSAELEVLEENADDEEYETSSSTPDDDDEDYDNKDAVSLVRAPNSVGFLNDVEAKSCYF